MSVPLLNLSTSSASFRLQKQRRATSAASRALELGADDVVSAPVEPVEFHTGWVIGGFNGANDPDLASAIG